MQQLIFWNRYAKLLLERGEIRYDKKGEGTFIFSGNENCVETVTPRNDEYQA